jgi:hypothetical protein
MNKKRVSRKTSAYAIRKAIKRGHVPPHLTANKCLYCESPTPNKFCSCKCMGSYKESLSLALWKAGKKPVVNAYGQVRSFVRKYLFDKFNSKCVRCGWAEINPTSGKIPLQVEHLDGNSGNNEESNLTLLCPNCHSLTATYMALNIGKGRASRRARAKAGLSF